MRADAPVELPPHDLEAERAVLGSVLLEQALLDRLSLVADDWYSQVHRTIWQAMTTLRARREPVDSITVGDELRRRGLLDDVGGDAYLASLFNAVPTWVNGEHYAQIVRRLSVYRQLIDAAGRIGGLAYNAPTDVDGALGQARALLDAIARHQPSGATSVGDLSLALIDAVGQMEYHPDGTAVVPTAGITWGIPEVDSAFGEITPGEYTIVAARPGVGKSALATWAALCNAERGVPAGIKSLEMSKGSLHSRLVTIKTGIATKVLLGRRWRREQADMVASAASHLAGLPLWIDDGGGRSIEAVRSACLRMVQEHKLRLLVVDYLQLIGTGDEYERVTAASLAMQQLAHELGEYDCATVVLSQFNRTGEDEPTLDNLRGSGGIEENGDTIVALVRPDRAVPVVDTATAERAGACELRVLKQRNGPLGVAHLMFELWSQRWRTDTGWQERERKGGR